MTTRDLVIKWTAYAVALLPVWFLDSYLFSRFPVFGVHPMLLPLAAVTVAVLEGGVGGAWFSLAVGVLWDAVTPGTPGIVILIMAAVGLGAGMVSRYALRQDLLGCFLCSAVALALVDAGRIALRLFWQTAPLEVMLSLALREILWSLCFVPGIYVHFRWVFLRTPKPTVL